jgi:hypothetical protein
MLVSEAEKLLLFTENLGTSLRAGSPTPEMVARN